MIRASEHNSEPLRGIYCEVVRASYEVNAGSIAYLRKWTGWQSLTFRLATDAGTNYFPSLVQQVLGRAVGDGPSVVRSEDCEVC
jgi:hypothetical protein